MKQVYKTIRDFTMNKVRSKNPFASKAAKAIRDAEEDIFHKIGEISAENDMVMEDEEKQEIVRVFTEETDRMQQRSDEAEYPANEEDQVLSMIMQ